LANYERQARTALWWCAIWKDKRERLYIYFEANLPQNGIIGGVVKIAGMIWIVKHFQTLLMSALIAVIFNSAYSKIFLIWIHLTSSMINGYFNCDSI